MQAKVVLVTGALTGIGQATALAFVREGGARVVVCGRREDAGKASSSLPLTRLRL
jgi:NAD(P)-dependent dehydrogenase (short-subunit alcohol dehydrogenase family)